jgi:prepilin-type N-terminal cleavage/methylation domain-containing protein
MSLKPALAMAAAARRGFTLLEVLIAAVLLTVALVGSLALSVGLLRGNQFNRERDTAYFLAQQQLDLLAVQPITQILSNPALFPNTSIASTSSVATCYSIGQDDFIDSPISCIGPPPAAYYVRTWVCCNAGGVGASIPAGTPCNATGAAIVSPDGAGAGGVCYTQVEITWPTEPAGVGANAPWAGGFADTVFTTVPPLNFTNHIYESMVRAQ